jgi:hypothetical protein
MPDTHHPPGLSGDSRRGSIHPHFVGWLKVGCLGMHSHCALLDGWSNDRCVSDCLHAHSAETRLSGSSSGCQTLGVWLPSPPVDRLVGLEQRLLHQVGRIDLPLQPPAQALLGDHPEVAPVRLRPRIPGLRSGRHRGLILPLPLTSKRPRETALTAIPSNFFRRGRRPRHVEGRQRDVGAAQASAKY